jgi:uncharacterized membrane protein
MTVGLVWLLFGGTHVGLATRHVRTRLVARLGEGGFVALYSLIAAVSFTALVGTYAALRDEGAPGLGLGPLFRPVLIAVIATGIALSVAGIVPYPSSSYALFRTTSRPEPRGLERITRHPFFAGTALLGVGHALLASRMTGVVFFGGLALLSLAGAWHQDRKLLAARGADHAALLAQTSMLPFAAILTGRQRLVARELPLAALALGGAAAWALGGAAHAQIFAHGGAWVVIAVIGGAALASLQAWQRTGLRGRPLLERILGPALVLIGIVHLALTFVLFPDAMRTIADEGVAGAISTASDGDVQAAFWFALFGPALMFLGWMTSHALIHDDRALVGGLAWFLVGTGVAGAVIMPVSGFWSVLAIGTLLLRVAAPRPCNVAERAL